MMTIGPTNVLHLLLFQMTFLPFKGMYGFNVCSYVSVPTGSSSVLTSTPSCRRRRTRRMSFASSPALFMGYLDDLSRPPQEQGQGQQLNDDDSSDPSTGPGSWKGPFQNNSQRPCTFRKRPFGVLSRFRIIFLEL
jgi:hypothetical protein